jgi:hypothetical protein
LDLLQIFFGIIFLFLLIWSFVDEYTYFDLSSYVAYTYIYGFSVNEIKIENFKPKLYFIYFLGVITPMILINFSNLYGKSVGIHLLNYFLVAFLIFF